DVARTPGSERFELLVGHDHELSLAGLVSALDVVSGEDFAILRADVLACERCSLRSQHAERDRTAARRGEELHGHRDEAEADASGQDEAALRSLEVFRQFSAPSLLADCCGARRSDRSSLSGAALP